MMVNFFFFLFIIFCYLLLVFSPPPPPPFFFLLLFSLQINTRFSKPIGSLDVATGSSIGTNQFRDCMKIRENGKHKKTWGRVAAPKCRAWGEIGQGGKECWNDFELDDNNVQGELVLGQLQYNQWPRNYCFFYCKGGGCQGSNQPPNPTTVTISQDSADIAWSAKGSKA